MSLLYCGVYENSNPLQHIVDIRRELLRFRYLIDLAVGEPETICIRTIFIIHSVEHALTCVTVNDDFPHEALKKRCYCGLC